MFCGFEKINVFISLELLNSLKITGTSSDLFLIQPTLLHSLIRNHFALYSVDKFPAALISSGNIYNGSIMLKVVLKRKLLGLLLEGIWNHSLLLYISNSCL